MNQEKREKIVKGKYVIMTLVCLVFGYMISFSYHLTEQQNDHTNMTSSQFARDLELRTEYNRTRRKKSKVAKGTLSKTNTSFENGKRTF